MARCIISALLAMCLVLGLCTYTCAELTAFWQNNPITSEAIADDPALANMQSWSVMVTNTSGHWTSAGLRAMLPAQTSFYRNGLGGATRPSVAQQSANPALTFHTYVTSPFDLGGGNNPSILGPFPETQPPLSFGGPADAVPGLFSVSWAEPRGFTHQPPGTYEIARLTFPSGVLPTVHPESRTSYFLPDQTVFIPTTIPEPTTLALLIGALEALGLRRRRTRSSSSGS